MKKQEKVSVVIANYNGEKFLDTCLRSVLKTDYEDFEILVVDDGSCDKSNKITTGFLEKGRRVKLIKNEKNIGAAASRNKAAKIAKGEILVFLDNDTEVDENWLKEIVGTIHSDKKIGACQSLLLDFQKRDLIQVAGVRLWAATGWGLGIGEEEKNNGQYNKEEDIIALSAAMAVKRDVFEKVGGFDEKEAVVTEDLDLSWRLWIAGYRVVLSPRSVVYHWTKTIEMRKNMKHTDETIYYHLCKNSLRSIVKNYEIKNVIKYLPQSIFINIGRGIFAALTSRDVSAIKGSLKGFIWFIFNLKDTLSKRQKVAIIREIKDDMLLKRVILDLSLLRIYSSYFKKFYEGNNSYVK